MKKSTKAKKAVKLENMWSNEAQRDAKSDAKKAKGKGAVAREYKFDEDVSKKFTKARKERADQLKQGKKPRTTVVIKNNKRGKQ